MRVDHVTRESRAMLDPSTLGRDEVFHYSIPAIQERGDGKVEPASEIASLKLLVDEEVVLVSKLNPDQGIVISATPRGMTTVASSEFVALKAYRIDRRFLQYLFMSHGVRCDLVSRTQSATKSHRRAKPDDIRKTWFAMPLRPMQERVADYLDSEMARIDALIDRKQHFIDLLLEKRAALITHAVTKGLDPNAEMKDSGCSWLGEVPAHWRVRKLRHVADVRRGTADKTVVLGERPTHLIQYTDIYYRRQQKADSEFLPISVTESEWAKSRVAAGDILVTASSETSDDIGHSSLVGDGLADHVFGSDVVRVRLRPGVCAAGYGKYLMENAIYLAIFDSLSRGVTRFRFSMDDFKNVVYVLPPIPEQEAIVAVLDSEYERTERLVEATRTSVELLREYRTALISAAVTGQIDIPGTEASEVVA